jgi:sn-glycerol 3-phosphate transport system substrate-binding protein
MIRARATGVVVGLALVAALGACGGGTSSGTSATTTPIASPGGTGASSPSALVATSVTGDANACPLGALANADSPVKLTFWYVDTGVAGDALTSLVAKYNASQAKVHVDAIPDPQPDVKFFAGMRSGRLPDLLQTDGISFIQRAEDSGAVLPVGDCLLADHADTSDFLPRAISAYSVNGALWAMPYEQTSLVLYYNRDAFQAAGLDPDRAPKTLDELEADSKAIMASKFTPHGVSWEANNTTLSTLLSRSGQTMVDNENGRAGRATHLTIDNPLGMEAFTKVHEMVGNGTAILAGDDTTALLAMGNRDVAMVVGASSSEFGDVRDAMKKQHFNGVDVGIAPLPVLRASSTGGTNFRGAPLFLTKGKDPVRVEAAYRFALWMSEPAQQAELHIRTGSVPVRTSVAELPAVKALWAREPLFRVAYDDLSTKGMPPGGGAAVYGPVADLAKDITDQWNAGAAKTGDPAAALALAVKKSDADLHDYAQEVGAGG